MQWWEAMTDTRNDDASSERLPSEELAALIVDALLRANILQEKDVERALRIAVEEIDVRKVLGDY